jgi:hypothetical protein
VVSHAAIEWSLEDSIHLKTCNFRRNSLHSKEESVEDVSRSAAQVHRGKWIDL